MTGAGWGKQLGCLIIITAGLLAAAPQVSAGGSQPAHWAVLVYVSEDADLHPLGARYLRSLEVSTVSDQVVAAAEVVSQDGARRCWYGQGGWNCESVQSSEVSQSARIANLIKWGMDQVVAERYALVVAGHGRLAPLVSAEDGGEGNSLTVGDLRTALAAGLAERAGQQLDVLFLDCCFGATVEVAAELSDLAGYLVGTPGLMYSPGLPWDEILAWLVRHPEAEPRALARQAVRSLGRFWRDEPDLPVSLVAIDLSRTQAVGERVAALGAAASARLPAAIPEITLARSRAESWGGQAELVDLGGFAAALGVVSASSRGGVAQQAHQLARAIERAVVASHLQGPLAPWRIRHQGLAVFFPLSAEQWPETYRGPDDGEFRKCWRPFLSAYVTGLHQLLVGELALEAGSGQL